MSRIEELETPTPVVDLDVVEANLQKMQAYVSSHGLRFRPHVKTHKIPEFALRQVELGAQGITCQKLGEAEVMADAGVLNILISYPLVGVGKLERLAALASRVQVSVAVDSARSLETASQAAKVSGKEIGVFVEFDSGAGRTGVVSVPEALALTRSILQTPGLRFEGLMTYPLNNNSAAFFEEAEAVFGEVRISIHTFSGGATPAAWTSHMIRGLTEVRHGTYIYHDRKTVASGVATLADCAFHVIATVVSRPSKARFILDSGSKSFSSDTVPEWVGLGYGLIREYPNAVIEALYEEHALVTVSDGDTGPAVGDRVLILPNHVCPVSNLHDEIPVHRQGELEGVLRVAARGKTR